MDITPREEGRLKSAIERYQQKIFALVLYLAGGNSNQAYDITADSFAEAFLADPSLAKEESLLANIAGIAIEKCRNTKIMPSSDDPVLIDLPPHKRSLLLITKKSLQLLPIDDQLLLILRDQLHLPYKNIAAILHLAEGNIKIQISQVRVNLRDAIKGMLNNA